MDLNILKNLVIINGTDIWTEFGVFLTEEKKGGRENLTSLLTASKVKGHVGVDIREEHGAKYSDELTVRNEQRNIQLLFCLVADSKEKWMDRYSKFIAFLKQGDNGWLEIRFSELNLRIRVFFVENGSFSPLTYIWKEGVHAARFKVTFCEPAPTF